MPWQKRALHNAGTAPNAESKASVVRGCDGNRKALDSLRSKSPMRVLEAMSVCWTRVKLLTRRRAPYIDAEGASFP